MTVLLAEGIETYKNKIATFTGVNVTLGMPDDSEPGLYFFPYNCLDEPAFLNISPRPMESPPHPPYIVKCLLIPSPSIDYVILGKGLNCINANPFLRLNSGNIQIVIESISTEELASLFISTGTTHRLSIPFHMRYIPH